MIIRSFKVSNWGPHLGTFSSDELSERVNIIVGPNESGKTTLIEALTRCLFDKHSTTDKHIESLVPWGRSVTPSVEIVFDHDGTTYRLAKSFIKNARSVLERDESGEFRPLHDGDDADEFMRGILESTMPGRGATKPEHRGLHAWLWTVQGDIELPSNVPGEQLAQRIARVGETTFSTGRERAILARVQGRVDTYFTPTGRPKGTSPVTSLADELGKAKGERVVLAERLREIEQLEQEIRASDERKNKLEVKVSEMKKDHASAKDGIDAAKEHQALRLQAEKEHLEASEELGKGLATLAKIEELIEGISDRRAESREMTTRISDLEGELSSRKRTLEEARSALTTEMERGRELHKGLEDSRLIEKYYGKKDALDTLRKRGKTLESDIKEIERAKRSLTEMVAPDKEEMSKIRKLQQDARSLEVKLGSVGLNIELRPHKGMTASLTLDGNEEELSLKKGSAERRAAAESIAIAIPKVVDITVSGKLKSARKVREKLESMENELAVILESYGEEDMEKLQELSNDRAVEVEALRRLEKRLAEEFPDVDDIEHLNTDIAKREKALAVLERKAFPGKGKRTVLEKALERIDELDKDIKASDRKQKKIGKGISVLGKEVEGLDTSMSGLTAARNETKRDLSVKEGLRDELENDGLSIEKRRKHINKLRLEADKERTAWEALEAEKKEVEEDPMGQLNAAEKRVEQARGLLGKESERIARSEALLEVAIRNGSYSMLARTEELIAVKEVELAEEELDSKAWKLLLDAVTRKRQEQLSAVLEPVTSRVTDNLRYIVGSKYSRVNFSEKVFPETVAVQGMDGPKDVGSLSFGTKEQIYLLTRLALADLLSADERRVVVLDDPLAHTDPTRLKRTIEVIDRVSRKAQVMIVTCRGDDYLGFEEPRVIEIGAGLPVHGDEGPRGEEPVHEVRIEEKKIREEDARGEQGPGEERIGTKGLEQWFEEEKEVEAVHEDTIDAGEDDEEEASGDQEPDEERIDTKGLEDGFEEKKEVEAVHEDTIDAGEDDEEEASGEKEEAEEDGEIICDRELWGSFLDSGLEGKHIVDLCTRNSLATSGTKAEMIERILDSLEGDHSVERVGLLFDPEFLREWCDEWDLQVQEGDPNQSTSFLRAILQEYMDEGIVEDEEEE